MFYNGCKPLSGMLTGLYMARRRPSAKDKAEHVNEGICAMIVIVNFSNEEHSLITSTSDRERAKVDYI